jgi:hypothetical protein
MEMNANRAGSARWTWGFWGIATGVLGFAGHMLSATDIGDEARRSGVGVIDELDYRQFHLGVVAGIAAVFCLLALAAEWRRWAARNVPDSLAADIVSLAFVASAGAMILGYGFKGSLATYLPGAPEADSYPKENLVSVFMFDDFGPFIAWWGVAMAALAIAWLSLRERALPLWLGIASAIFGIVPYAVLCWRGLPGFPGVIDPLWIVLFGIGMAIHARKTVEQPALRLAAAD